MDYLVNDIENIIQLNKMGVFESIHKCCNSMSITNIRRNDFSAIFNKEIDILKNKGVIEIEVDFEYFIHLENHKSQYNGLGPGDISSLYQSNLSGQCIITNNKILINCAKRFKIETIKTGEFLEQFIKDVQVNHFFNNVQIN